MVGATFLSSATAANAALTSSEKGQIKDFVGGARAEDAQKVRSLVARTDLTAEESAAALSEAIAPVAFTEQRGGFLRELAFGGTSAPSRPVLVLAEVKALVARADAIYQRYVGGLDHEPKAIAELASIYGFIDRTIANAGKPTTTAHDGAAGIPAATYDECSKVLRDHLERQARWLKADAQVPASVVHLRAQAELALIDMLPDGLTRRADAADRLGLKGARRTLLTESGILFADSGGASDEKIERVRQILTRLPGARSGLSAIELGASDGRLSARGEVVQVGVASEPYPFANEAAGRQYDPTTSAIAHELSVLAAKRALDGRAELRAQVEHDAASSSGDSARLLGRPRAPSVEHVLGAAIHALLTDAPRAIDLSFACLVGGRPETAALLSDALGAMAAFATPEKDAKEVKLEVGKASEWTPMTAVRLAPNGVALAFTIDGHAWTIDRASPSYAVLAGRRDGKPVSLNQLSSKGIPRDGAQWIDSGYTFNKMRGAPRVALSAGAEKTGPDVKLIGGGAEGFDVVTVAPPGADFVFEGTLDVRDAPGGVAFRTSPTAKGFRGGALVISPKGPTVLAVIEDGAQTNLGTLDPSPAGALPVKIRVTGKKVEAIVGKTTLSGTLPDTLAGGDVAVIGKKNANVDIGAFTLKRN